MRSIRSAIAALMVGLGQIVLPATGLAADRFVSTGGSDAGNDCSSSAAPCQSISHALTQVGSGDTVKIARGIYTDHVEISSSLTLVLSGGWTPDFTARDPKLNKTTLRDRSMVFAGAGVVIDLTVDGVTHVGPAASPPASVPGIGLHSYADGQLAVTIANSTVTRHKTSFGPAGIAVYASGTSTLNLSLSDSVVSRIKDYGIYVYSSDSSAVGFSLVRSRIESNPSIGMNVQHRSLGAMDIAISDSTFARNRRGGMKLHALNGSDIVPMHVTIDRSTFIRNRTRFP